ASQGIADRLAWKNLHVLRSAGPENHGRGSGRMMTASRFRPGSPATVCRWFATKKQQLLAVYSQLDSRCPHQLPIFSNSGTLSAYASFTELTRTGYGRHDIQAIGPAHRSLEPAELDAADADSAPDSTIRGGRASGPPDADIRREFRGALPCTADAHLPDNLFCLSGGIVVNGDINHPRPRLFATIAGRVDDCRRAPGRTGFRAAVQRSVLSPS